MSKRTILKDNLERYENHVLPDECDHHLRSLVKKSYLYGYMDAITYIVYRYNISDDLRNNMIEIMDEFKEITKTRII